MLKKSLIKKITLSIFISSFFMLMFVSCGTKTPVSGKKYVLKAITNKDRILQKDELSWPIHFLFPEIADELEDDLSIASSIVFDKKNNCEWTMGTETVKLIYDYDKANLEINLYHKDDTDKEDIKSFEISEDGKELKFMAHKTIFARYYLLYEVQ